VDSLEFITRMKNIEFLKLSNGEISDFSPLKELPVLDSLILDEMNKLTDISFAKDMELGYFSVIDMPQITDEQKMDVIKFHDADISVGYTAIIGVTPNGLLKSRDCHIEIKDTAIANFENSNVCTKINGALNILIGVITFYSATSLLIIGIYGRTILPLFAPGEKVQCCSK
jgi:hypothetical protein